MSTEPASARPNLVRNDEKDTVPAIIKKDEKPSLQSAESFPLISTSKAVMDELEKDLFLSSKGPPLPPSAGLGLLTGKEFEEALLLLKYDLHLEMQAIVKEQIRQFTINQVSNLITNFCNNYYYYHHHYFESF